MGAGRHLAKACTKDEQGKEIRINSKFIRHFRDTQRRKRRMRKEIRNVICMMERRAARDRLQDEKDISPEMEKYKRPIFITPFSSEIHQLRNFSNCFLLICFTQRKMIFERSAKNDETKHERRMTCEKYVKHIRGLITHDDPLLRLTSQ